MSAIDIANAGVHVANSKKNSYSANTGFTNTSSGGFFNNAFGQFIGTLLGPLASDAMSREMTANENELSRMHDVQMSHLAQSNALEQLRMQQQFALGVESSKYQRQVADMVAAGLNPASVAGSAIAGGSIGNPGNSVGTSGGHAGVLGFSNSGIGSSMINSAFNAILAKDKQAADIAKSELVDNARHAHKMEELNERMQWLVSRDSAKRSFETDVNRNPKADYYDELATALRYKRLGIDNG